MTLTQNSERGREMGNHHFHDDWCHPEHTAHHPPPCAWLAVQEGEPSCGLVSTKPPLNLSLASHKLLNILEKQKQPNR